MPSAINSVLCIRPDLVCADGGIAIGAAVYPDALVSNDSAIADDRIACDARNPSSMISKIVTYCVIVDKKIRFGFRAVNPTTEGG